ncbi:MAG: DUF4012 domain-containing protein [Chloroflexi bacterium]|nr:DUF4012 domain-containing protein [Chloroflexota bacterium]
MLTEEQRAQLRQQVEAAQRRVSRRALRRRILRVLASCVGVLLLLYVLSGVFLGIETWRGTSALRRVAADASPTLLLQQPVKLQDLDSQLQSATSDLSRAVVPLPLWSPILAALGHLPHWGPLFQSASPLLQGTACLTASAADVSDVFASLSAIAKSQPPLQTLHDAAFVLQHEENRIKQARDQFSCAVAQRKRFSPQLSAISSRLNVLIAKEDAVLNELDQATSLILLLPHAAQTALGMDHSQSYLVLGQDPFELRATGGFVGGMGLVNVSNAQITKLDYRGVLDFETPSQPHLTPPFPLEHYMGIAAWYLRDANWSPNFPTSAKLEEQFFERDQHVQVNGVIAVDTYAVQDLLRAIGPVYVPQYAETISADNLLAELWKNINASGSITSQREMDKTDFLSALVRAVVAKLEQPANVNLTKLGAALVTSIQEKHLQVYFNNPSLEAFAKAAHADGSVWSSPGDGVEVVDTQVSYGKMTAVMKESEHLTVEIGPDGQVTRDTLTITYQNLYNELGALRVWKELHSELYNFRTNTMQNGTGIFATYVRVLTPLHTHLEQITGSDDTPGYVIADGKSQLTAYLVVHPGQTRSLTFAYQPDISRVATNEYALTLQKQPGTVANPITVDVHLAPQLHLVNPPSDWKRIAPSVWQLNTRLRTDEHLTLHWRYS